MSERDVRVMCHTFGGCAGDIARMAIRYNYISCQGKTPEATMASALYTDIKRKETASIFIRPHEGLFGLREWLDQGISIEVGPLYLPLMLDTFMHQIEWICSLNAFAMHA